MICYVFQAVINFFYFDLKNRINIILVNDFNVADEIKDYLDTVRIKYKFMFMINMLLMIFFWYYIINFSSDKWEIKKDCVVDYMFEKCFSLLSFPFKNKKVKNNIITGLIP